jgi:hypothetical protein
MLNALSKMQVCNCASRRSRRIDLFNETPDDVTPYTQKPFFPAYEPDLCQISSATRPGTNLDGTYDIDLATVLLCPCLAICNDVPESVSYHSCRHLGNACICRNV